MPDEQLLSANPAHSNAGLCDLSVIIVSWNVRDLLRACLRSVRASPGVTLARCPRDEEPLSGHRRPQSPSGLIVLPAAHPVSEEAGADTKGRGGASPPGVSLPGWHPPRNHANSQRASLPSVEVIVVDNASTDGSAAMVAAEFPWVRLVANSENRGFTGGNNQGLHLSQGCYVLFLNPDTEIVGDALSAMVSFMDVHPEIGALGPQLRYADGRLQSSRRRFPTFGMALFESTPLAWHWPPAANPWARRYHMADVPLPIPGEGAQAVDWVVGAALLARRTALDQVGGFDEGYFMYSEELDWCRRAASMGWRIVYFPAAQVIHHEGKSSEQVIAARHIRFQTSKIRYFRKFHGPVAAEALRITLLAAFSFEWIFEGSKWLLGSKRPLRRERLAAYGQLLCTGLGPHAGDL
jgi:N-acetylglucosaminyl-diphospho-decaprenol L-rhamnosyltransferase